MTPEQKAVVDKYIATPEGKAKLAAAMQVPIRCGGCRYDEDGNEWLYLGGWWVPSAVAHRAHRCTADLEILREYQRTHKRFTWPAQEA
jgi:hypothetical protein